MPEYMLFLEVRNGSAGYKKLLIKKKACEGLDMGHNNIQHVISIWGAGFGK